MFRRARGRPSYPSGSSPARGNRARPSAPELGLRGAVRRAGIRGEPPRVREGVELDHGVVEAVEMGGSERPQAPREFVTPRGTRGAPQSGPGPGGRARGLSACWSGVAPPFVLYPIAYLFQASLSVGDPQARPPEAYGLDNFTGLGRYAHILGNTLQVAAVATVMARGVRLRDGWILSRTNVPGRAAARAAHGPALLRDAADGRPGLEPDRLARERLRQPGLACAGRRERI